MHATTSINLPYYLLRLTIFTLPYHRHLHQFPTLTSWLYYFFIFRRINIIILLLLSPKRTVRHATSNDKNRLLPFAFMLTPTVNTAGFFYLGFLPEFLLCRYRFNYMFFIYILLVSVRAGVSDKADFVDSRLLLAFCLAMKYEVSSIGEVTSACRLPTSPSAICRDGHLGDIWRNNCWPTIVATATESLLQRRPQQRP